MAQRIKDLYIEDIHTRQRIVALYCTSELAKEIEQLGGVAFITDGGVLGRQIRIVQISPLYDFQEVLAEIRALGNPPMPDSFQELVDQTDMEGL